MAKFMKVMQQIRKKLRLAKYKEYVTQAIFLHKYQKYLAILNRFRRPIVKMQAIVRGRYARRAFLTMRDAATVIQKAFRRHLRKKYYLIRLWKDYRKNIYV